MKRNIFIAIAIVLVCLGGLAGVKTMQIKTLIAVGKAYVPPPESVSSAVAAFEGQVATFRGWEADKPCYRCFVGGDPERPEATCADQGVMGALTGVLGSLAALETIRALVPFGDDSAGKLLLVDALNLRFRTLVLPKDPGCPACGAAA